MWTKEKKLHIKIHFLSAVTKTERTYLKFCVKLYKFIE